MPRFRAWGLAATAAIGLGASAARADDPRPVRSSAPPTTVFAKLFGPSKPKVGPVARGSAPPTIVTPLPTDMVVEALRAEQEALNRRMMVCLKLRQVAMEANDEVLMRSVDDLERQATTLYNARAAALGVSRLAPRPALIDVDAPGEDFAAAKKAAANRLTAPAAPTAIDPAVRTAEARTPADVIREVPR